MQQDAVEQLQKHVNFLYLFLDDNILYVLRKLLTSFVRLTFICRWINCC